MLVDAYHGLVIIGFLLKKECTNTLAKINDCKKNILIVFELASTCERVEFVINTKCLQTLCMFTKSWSKQRLNILLLFNFYRVNIISFFYFQMENYITFKKNNCCCIT